MAGHREELGESFWPSNYSESSEVGATLERVHPEIKMSEKSSQT